MMGIQQDRGGPGRPFGRTEHSRMHAVDLEQPDAIEPGTLEPLGGRLR